MEGLRGFWDLVRSLPADLLHWVEAFAQSPHGGWALFWIAFAESSFFPIPPDALLIPLCFAEPTRALEFAALCSIGSVLGGIGGYGIGYFGGRPVLKRFFDSDRVRAVESYYERYNAWATGIAGLTPIPYKLFTISGGAFAVDFKIFVIASAVARSLRFFAVAVLIRFYGEAAKPFVVEHFGLLSVAFVILLVVGFLVVGRGVRRAGRVPVAKKK